MCSRVRVGDVPGRLLEPDRDQDRPEDGPEVVARPADDHRREQHHGLRVAPGRRGPRGDVGDQDAPGQAGDRANQARVRLDELITKLTELKGKP